MPGLEGILDDPLLLLVYAVLAIITGGIGTAIVNGHNASKRGIRGDALVKEQNGITGLVGLTEGQATFIENLQKQMKENQEEFKVELGKLRDEFQAKVDDLEGKLELEVNYSNLLINTMHENTIPVPPRPKRI